MTGTPWYDQQIAAMIATQIATRDGHSLIATSLREVARHLSEIATQHEALAATLPDAVQASADLATMAQAHHESNVAMVLTGEQELNQRRDAQVIALARGLAQIEAKIDQLLHDRCAACPLRPGDDPTTTRPAGP